VLNPFGAKPSECFHHKPFNGNAAHAGMPSDQYSPTMENESHQSAAGTPLDLLLHSKSRILRTKLDVLATEIVARLGIWNRNLERIHGEKAGVEELLDQSTRLARYHLRDQRDVGRLRGDALKLDTQQREEDVQCWKDVVLVMRDFLTAWESHEQAKSRAIFINHAGSGHQESL
jgi:hypothetical protein